MRLIKSHTQALRPRARVSPSACTSRRAPAAATCAAPPAATRALRSFLRARTRCQLSCNVARQSVRARRVLREAIKTHATPATRAAHLARARQATVLRSQACGRRRRQVAGHDEGRPSRLARRTAAVPPQQLREGAVRALSVSVAAAAALHARQLVRQHGLQVRGPCSPVAARHSATPPRRGRAARAAAF